MKKSSENEKEEEEKEKETSVFFLQLLSWTHFSFYQLFEKTANTTLSKYTIFFFFEILYLVIVFKFAYLRNRFTFQQFNDCPQIDHHLVSVNVRTTN